MSTDEAAVGTGPDARQAVLGLVFGQFAARALASAVSLGIADLFRDDTRTGGELAADLGAHPGAVRRLLRALAGIGLLVEVAPDSFALTATGAVLRTDRPDSMHPFVHMLTHPTMVDAWGHLDTSVRTGEPAFDAVFGTDFFGHLAGDPGLSALFNATMRQGTLATAAALPAGYDFARLGTVVDVGGGDGTLVAPVLAANPTLRAVLFDTPEGSAEATAVLTAAGVADRVRVESGDFFASVPAGGDLYLIKSVLHDWDDDRATTILRNVRAALPPHGRVLVVELLLPEVVDPGHGGGMYLSDLNMLVNLGGRERTATDFATLFAAADLTLTGITTTPALAPFALIEAAPAP